jgi:protein SCO1/2
MTTRRDLLLTGAAALPALALGPAVLGDPAAAAADEACERPARGPNAGWLPNVPVLAHDGRRALFYDDLVAGRRVLVHCFALVDPGHAAVLDNLAAVAELLGPALGRDVFFYSLALDAARDTPRALADEARRRALPDGWWLLTGDPPDVGLLRARLYAFAGGRQDAGPDPHAGHAFHGASPVDPAVPGPVGQDCSLGLLRYGNEAVGLWGSVPARTDPDWIARRLAWVAPQPPPAGAPRRRGPHPDTFRTSSRS